MGLKMIKKVEKPEKMTDNKKVIYLSPLDELYKLIELESDGQQNGRMIRKEALNRWIDRWVLELEGEQSVISREFLTSEYEDFIKESVVKDMSEVLTEEACTFNIKDTKFKAKLTVLRKRIKK